MQTSGFRYGNSVKLEFNDQEAESVLRTIDAGLKNIHIGGLNVAEGMNIFVGKLNRARQLEQNEKNKMVTVDPSAALHSSSSLPPS